MPNQEPHPPPTGKTGSFRPRLAQNTGPTDEQLVRQLQKGDGDAGAILVQRYDRMLLGYLRRLSGSDHTAEELHQATWLSALEHLEKFDARSTPGGFKAWIFRIATNKANDLWRRSGREQSAHHGWRLAREVAGEPDRRPESGLEARERAGKLHEAIGKLPDAQREVLLLRYYAGLKFTEIAETLGCPLNTALGRMHKGVLKLRQMLKKDPPEG